MTTTKVLYFPSNSKNKKGYYQLFVLLCLAFDKLTEISVDAVDEFLNDSGERFYVKELPYQLEIYNADNEYIFCINKPNVI